MQANYPERTAERKPEHCGRCQSVNLQEREKPPHIGLYCGDCGAWIRWIPRPARLKLATVNPSGPSAEGEQQLPLAEDPAPANCGHCPELDRLVRVMQGIERELIVIVRVLCNGVGR